MKVATLTRYYEKINHNLITIIDPVITWNVNRLLCKPTTGSLSGVSDGTNFCRESELPRRQIFFALFRSN